MFGMNIEVLIKEDAVAVCEAFYNRKVQHADLEKFYGSLDEISLLYNGQVFGYLYNFVVLKNGNVRADYYYSDIKKAPMRFTIVEAEIREIDGISWLTGFFAQPAANEENQ